MFASVVLDGVLGHLGLALHTVHFPVVWKQCMRQVKALEGRHVSSKTLQGSQTRVLLGRTEEESISGGHHFHHSNVLDSLSIRPP